MRGKLLRRGRDSNSRTRLSPVTHLAGERLQPARPPLQNIYLFEIGFKITAVHFHIKAVGRLNHRCKLFPQD